MLNVLCYGYMMPNLIPAICSISSPPLAHLSNYYIPLTEEVLQCLGYLLQSRTNEASMYDHSVIFQVGENFC